MKKQLTLLTLVLFFLAGIVLAEENAAPAEANDETAQTAEITAAPAEQQMPAMPQLPEIDPTVWDFIPETVATLGDTKITKQELIDAVKPRAQMMMMYGQQMSPDQYQMLAANAVDFLVYVNILEKMAAEAGYKATPELEKEVYDKLMTQIPEEQKKMLPELMKQQGVTEEQFKEQLAKEEALNNWVEDKVVPEVKVSEEEVKNFYNENKEKLFKKPESVTVSHILITPIYTVDGETEVDGKEVTKEQAIEAAEKANPDEDKAIVAEQVEEAALAKAKVEADEAYTKVKDGGDFAELAKEYSKCPSAQNGGQLGPVQKGQMVPEFEAAAFTLGDANADKEGNFNAYDEVETQFGWHIIDVTGYDKGGFQELTPELEESIKGQLTNEGVQLKLSELFEQEKAKINPVINLKVDLPEEEAPATDAAPAPSEG